MPNFDGTATTELHLTEDIATEVLIEFPMNAPTFTTTTTIIPEV